MLKTSGNVTDFSNAEFGLDGATAKGSIKVTTGGVRPRVEATLDVAELDLNKYLTSAVTGVSLRRASPSRRKTTPRPPHRPRRTVPEAARHQRPTKSRSF